MPATRDVTEAVEIGACQNVVGSGRKDLQPVPQSDMNGQVFKDCVWRAIEQGLLDLHSDYLGKGYDT